MIGAGLVLVAMGLLLAGWSRLGGPKPGRLPGDLHWTNGTTTLIAPFTTMILLSLVLTGVVALVRWWGR